MSDSPSPTLPVAKPVAVTKTPPAGRKFPCPACGARLDFDPAAAGLKCPYCGYLAPVQKDAAPEACEKDYLDYLTREEDNGTTLEGRSSQVRCGGCGAVVLLEDRVATDRCPFCGTHLENQPEAADHLIAPEGVLPFAVDLRKARDAFTRWLGSLWFAPNELKRVANLGQLSGAYLPYWTYDAMTVTYYTGERGDDYQVTEWYTETKPDGTSERKSRTVTRTAWTWVTGEVRHFFDDVLVCGSRSLPADLIADLAPWDLEQLAGYQPDYLSGFKTERYAVGLKDGFGAAKEIMRGEIDGLVRRDIGGDHQRVSNLDIRHSGVTFKHILVPVWVAVYRYHEKTFQILVNGRTGKVTGYRPWSWSKIAAVAILVVAVLLAVLLLWARAGH